MIITVNHRPEPLPGCNTVSTPVLLRPVAMIEAEHEPLLELLVGHPLGRTVPVCIGRWMTQNLSSLTSSIPMRMVQPTIRTYSTHIAQYSEHTYAVLLKCRGLIGGGPLKDLFWSITRTHGQPSCLEFGDDVGWNYWKRITMEETHHALHRGLQTAYQEVFGNGLTTDLSLAIDQAYNDCE